MLLPTIKDLLRENNKKNIMKYLLRLGKFENDISCDISKNNVNY